VHGGAGEGGHLSLEHQAEELSLSAAAAWHLTHLCLSFLSNMAYNGTHGAAKIMA